MKTCTFIPFALLSLFLIATVAVSQEIPVIKKQVAPTYPALLKRAGIEGKVIISVLVNEQGVVEKASVVSSTNHDFDTSALDAVKQWQFAPAMKEGKPIKVELAIPFKYQLDADTGSKNDGGLEISRGVEKLLLGEAVGDHLAIIDTAAYVIVGNRMEKLRELLLDQMKRSMLVEGSGSKVVSSVEKIEQSGDSGFLILQTKPSDRQEERYHTIVFGKNKDGSWKIRCWQTVAKK